MHTAITLNRHGKKMSVCSEFVEHIWKPGSCKNCFHPRSDHRQPQSLSDGKNGNLPALHSLNGIKLKSGNASQDDDTVIAALYTKPTIAVKPTMLTSDNEMWTELNSTETLTQVSWKMSQTSNPFNQKFHTYNDNSPNYVFNGLKSPDRKMGINAVNNLTYVSHFSGQSDKATFIKETLPTTFEQTTNGNLVNGDAKTLSSIQEESTLLSLKSSSGCSSGTLSSTERTTPPGTLLTRGISVSQGTAKSGMGQCNLGNPTPIKPTRKFQDKNCLKSLELGSNKKQNCSDLKLTLNSESDTLTSNLSCSFTRDNPLGSPPYKDSQTSEFHLSKDSKNLAKHSQQLTYLEDHLQIQAEGSNSEPIYAESTKRKGVLSRLEIKPQAQRNTEKNVLSPNRPIFEEKKEITTTQIAAKITVMAAHTEEDNRTIFLSSPDSAVGVQWKCNSPLSSSGNSNMSQFVWGERIQGRQELKATELNKRYCGPLSPKSQGNSSTVVSSMLIKPEECTSMKLSSPTHTAGILHLSSQKKESLEVNDRCLQSTERRHRYYQAQWSKQCKIDEEEEEEASVSQPSRINVVSNGQLTKSSFNYEDKSSVEEQKSRKGMSKSASCPVELSKANHEKYHASQPPPPPPKKQTRHPLKLNKSSTDLDVASLGSVESLGESCKATNVLNVNVSFSTGSIDSLDSRTCSEEGHCFEVVNSPSISPGGKKKHFTKILSLDSGEDSQHGAIQPPPLPVKKSMNRASSVPDNSALGRTNHSRTLLNSNNPRYNLSQSENNVCGEIATQSSLLLSPGEKHVMFSSSESLEKCCRGSGHRNEVRTRNSVQGKGLSSSQLSVSSQNTSGSSLQLHHLLSNIDSKEGMYGKLSGLYAQSMRRLVNKCEDHFMREQKQELHFNENNWSLFKITSNKPCCIAGHAIYYCVKCSKDPCNNYSVKMCKSEDAKAPSSLSLPVHFNIQQECGSFVATVPTNMLHPPDVSKGPSSNDSSQTVGPASEQECVVVITREVPYLTAAEFVDESVSAHKLQPEVYERQVCLLLLQLCNGLEHLKEHGIIHRDLCLENLLLVHWQNSSEKVKDVKYVPRLIVSNFSKAKQRPGCEESQPRRDKTRLAPEIMAASQYKKFDEFQTGILIYELLHQPNPFEVRTSLHEHDYSQKDLPSLPGLSVYSRGLQHLAHLLLEADPIKRIRISEAKRVLQCLLWGPRKDLTDQPFSHEEAFHCALQNWVDMKRALLMMKFAEQALEPQQNISLEDWLCCQYLASADPCYLYKTLKLIKLIASVSSSAKI
ncbi:inactive tyrosine-protein kinase PRAG1 [Xenopus laevis]|uniref:Inactive tyrosine-protein kinase PRAG1 n=3 Tax=Xenopus laevis TaxID=8355 RepID=A0A1L8HMM8_XENLA|nr:inactive tyrosine-protein kinase PRAG1 [Xenopus laevis]XP_041435670.1 inactive tyrosine-protein kinase PRAG1 [Xenopus laevis]OCT97334.1 hypothetical protein XELAEV_18009561mg [Xenopus laevis]